MVMSLPTRLVPIASPLIPRVFSRGAKLYVRSSDGTPLKRLDQYAIERTLNKAKSLKESHYVFSHGQSMEIGTYTDLLTEIWQMQHPEAAAEQGDCIPVRWRAPGTYAELKTAEEFWKSKYGGMEDNFIRHSLLSVDGSIGDDREFESAISFFLFKGNIVTHGQYPEERFHSNRLQELRQLHGVRDKYFQTHLATITQTLQKGVKQNGDTARIYLIAVPKLLLQDPQQCFAYRSHPLGFQCNCFESHHDTFIKILEAQQEDKGVICMGEYPPQYRLLIHGLQEADSVRYYASDSMEKKQRMNYRKEIGHYISVVRLVKMLEDPKFLNSSQFGILLQDAYIQESLMKGPGKEAFRSAFAGLLRKSSHVLTPVLKQLQSALSEANVALFDQMLDGALLRVPSGIKLKKPKL